MFFHILKILIKLTYLIFKVYLTQPQTIRRYVRWLALNPCRQESLHPKDYQMNLIRLSNGKQVDSRIYPSLQKMFNDARANGLALFVREGYRTAQDQQQIMNERIREYENQGYSKPQATKMAEKYVAIPGTSEHQLGLSVDINANQTKMLIRKKYTVGLIIMHINTALSSVIHPTNLISQEFTMNRGITDMLEKKRLQR